MDDFGRIECSINDSLPDNYDDWKTSPDFDDNIRPNAPGGRIVGMFKSSDQPRPERTDSLYNHMISAGMSHKGASTLIKYDREMSTCK